MITLNLNRPLSSIVVDSGECDTDENLNSAQVEAFLETKTREFEAKKQQIGQLAAALSSAAAALNDIQANVIAENQTQLGQLAIEIARKILGKEIEESRYDIKGIISNMLNAAPTLEKATLKLNVDDYESLRNAAPSELDVMLESIKIESDWSVKPAECVLETSKGIVEYIIEDQLQRLSEAFSGN